MTRALAPEFSARERPPTSFKGPDADALPSTLSPGQPRLWLTSFSTTSNRMLQRVFGWRPFRNSYFSLFQLSRSPTDRALLASGIIFAVAAGLPLPIIGVLFGKIINNFPPPEHELVTRLAELLGVAVAYFVVTTAYTISWGLTGERVSRNFREAIVKKLLGLDQAFFDNFEPDVTNLLTEKIELIQIGTAEKAGIFIQSITYFIAAFVVGFILNARLTGILFAAVIPLMTFIVCYGSSRGAKYAKRASDYASRANRLAESAISSVQVVQAFGMSGQLCNEYRRLLSLSARHAMRKSVVAATVLAGAYFVAYAANALAFYVGSTMTRSSGGNNAGTIYAVVFLILDASFVVGQFGPFLGAFANAAAAGDQIIQILDRPQSSIDIYDDGGDIMADAVALKDITFAKVSFSYPSRKTEPALDAVDLILLGGALNAVVGESGSGKSTLVSLILRLYDVDDGRISIGASDIRKLNVKNLRAHISLVDQESTLFSGSILDNIADGLSQQDALLAHERVKRCTEAAEAAGVNFLDRLPDGIHTLIGQGGTVKLSGGQMQRICMARALVKRPSILLLDEPTASLDSTSESLVIGAVKRAASSGCTVVMVTHRLSTVSDFESIAYMKDGNVIEHGCHSDLIARDGAYAALVNAQGLATQERPSSVQEQANPLTADNTHEDDTSEANSHAESPVTSSEQQANKSKLSMTTIIGRCLKISRNDSSLLLFGLSLSIISGGIVLGEAIIFGNLVQLIGNSVSEPDFLSRVGLFCLLFFVLAIIALISYSGSGSCFGVASAHFVATVQLLSLENILRQDMQWFSGRTVSTLISTLQSEAGQLSCLSGVALGTIFTVMTSVCGGIILAHVVAWKIAIVPLAAVPVMIIAGYVRLRVISLSETRHRSAYNDAAAIAAETFRSIRTVAALGKERRVFDIYTEALKSPYQNGIKFTLISNVLLSASISITYFIYALAYWWGSRQVRSDTYDELQFFIVLPALLFSAQSAGQIFNLSPEIARAGTAARSIFGLHDEAPTIMVDEHRALPPAATKSCVSSPSTTSFEKIDGGTRKGRIDVQSVSLTYTGTSIKSRALVNVNLSILPGEFVTFVGASGAGKSSMVSLLERFYDPTEGRILIDGEDVRDRPASAHRRRLGLVPQEPDLFPGSVSYNISLGSGPDQTVTEERIREVCEQCNIHDFITSLPEGYDTECGPNGSKLSGGQKQRIALARALIRAPDILLLDEYTSALDAHSEKEIQEAIMEAAQQRTTIVVAHRLSTIQHADRIYVFDRGRVVEVGAHAELAGRGGIYASMVRAQTFA